MLKFSHNIKFMIAITEITIIFLVSSLFSFLLAINVFYNISLLHISLLHMFRIYLFIPIISLPIISFILFFVCIKIYKILNNSAIMYKKNFHTIQRSIKNSYKLKKIDEKLQFLPPEEQSYIIENGVYFVWMLHPKGRQALHLLCVCALLSLLSLLGIAYPFWIACSLVLGLIRSAQTIMEVA